MARLPRLAIAGALHHLMLCGRDGLLLARDTQDRELLLSVLRDAAVGQGVAIHAYALLDHELHLLCTPTEASGLGRMVQALGRSYVAAFNRRHARRGALWEGRYRCSVVSPDLLHDATVHIETLPVDAGLASSAAEWPWSSAPHHTGARRDPVVAEHVGYWTLGNTPFDRESAHAHMLSLGVPTGLRQSLADAVRRGHAIGPAEFVQHIGEIAKRPVQALRRGRPRRIVT